MDRVATAARDLTSRPSVTASQPALDLCPLAYGAGRVPSSHPRCPQEHVAVLATGGRMRDEATPGGRPGLGELTILTSKDACPPTAGFQTSELLPTVRQRTRSRHAIDLQHLPSFSRSSRDSRRTRAMEAAAGSGRRGEHRELVHRRPDQGGAARSGGAGDAGCSAPQPCFEHVRRDSRA